MNRLLSLSARRVLQAVTVLLIAVACAACVPLRMAAPPASPGTAGLLQDPALQPATALPPLPAACALPAVVPPTPPATVPGYAQEDNTTGLHVTGTAQAIDLATYRLVVTGSVARELALTYDQLRCLPKVEKELELVCPGFFVDKARWAGVPLADVLALAGPRPGAAYVRLKSADGYSSSTTITEALTSEVFLAYEWNGEPLPYLHGFPLRAVFPTETGSRWVKWLVELRVE